MHNRTTAILGAGTVLGFDFGDLLKPTTSNITQAVVQQRITDFEGNESDLIKQIYDLIVSASQTEYLKSHPAVIHYDPQVNFEDLFEVIETLYSYNGTWEQERFPFPLIAVLIRPTVHHKSVEYYRAMIAIIVKIIDIVNSYDLRFKKSDRESWYKGFWKSFDGKIDVFNLNYDTTIESSLENYVDGFVGFTQDYERFEPEVIWDASEDKSTVNHLHGCILYGDLNPKPMEFRYSHRDLYKFYPDAINEAFFSGQWLPTNQVGDTILYSPIITGLKKTDKICYMPHSIYHANLVKKIIKNPSLLICGYSFGDLYINQLLQRHKLIHNKKQRVVIIDRWPDYVNEDNVTLCKYFMDNTTGGQREFVESVIESCINPHDTFKQFIQVSDGCWQSPNGVLRLYTKGFKNAVENHRKELLDYLRENKDD